MIKKMTITNTVKLILSVVTIFLVIIFSGSVWQISDMNLIYSYTLVAVAIVLFFTTIYYKNTINRKLEKKTFVLIYLILMPVLVFLSNFVNENINYYVSLLSMIIVSYCITEFVNIYKFIRIFTVVLAIISIISLIYYIFLNYLDFTVPSSVVISNNGITYFKHFLNFSLTNPVRNIGVFWEPGVFSSILLYALVLRIIFYKKIINFYNFIFVITIFTTQSTAGYVILFLIFIMSIFEIKKKKIKVILLFVILFVIFLVYISLVYQIEIINSEVIEKLILFDKDNMRYQSILFNKDLFLKKPIFGNGFVFVNEFTQNSNIIISGENIMQTSTSAYLLASAGLYGSFYTLIWIYGILSNNKNTKISKLYLIIIFISIINKEVHISIMITHIILFYLLSNFTGLSNSYE
jgi:hypothetical protein